MVLCAATLSHAADDEFFESRIRPLLIARCQGCHATLTGRTSGGLALDSRQGWQTGGDSGPVIVPGDPEASLLLRAVKHADGVAAMPPEDAGLALTAAEIADLSAWIAAGAADPRHALQHIQCQADDAVHGVPREARVEAQHLL